MRTTLLFLVGLGIAGAVGAWFAKKEVDKLLDEMEDYDYRF